MRTPVGTTQPTRKARSKASRRKPRRRMCLRKGCGQRYEPKRWNQLYCQDPECAARPSGAAHRKRKPNMPLNNARAARRPRRPRKRRPIRLFRPRVVTPPSVFFAADLRPAGVLRSSPTSGPPRKLLLQPPLPERGPERPRPRAQVEVPWHVSRPEEARLRICGGAPWQASGAPRETIAAG
jgi:hypothetical protein